MVGAAVAESMPEVEEGSWSWRTANRLWLRREAAAVDRLPAVLEELVVVPELRKPRPGLLYGLIGACFFMPTDPAGEEESNVTD